MTILLLLGLLGVFVVGVLVASRIRHAGRMERGMSDNASVLSVDMGRGVDAVGVKALTLRDDEWGVTGVPDLVLEECGGPVPVEWKRANMAPRALRPSHQVQLGVYFMVCESDPQVAKRPSHGEVQYLDHEGRLLLNGRFKVINSSALRQQVIEIVRAMRNLLRGGEAHRNHEMAAKCRGCSVKVACGEGLA